MLVWFSPFPQEPHLLDQLAAAGIEPHPGPESALPAGSLLLYDPPDVVLQQARLRAAPRPRLAALVAAYQQLAALRSGRRLIASWRLCGVEAAAVEAWLQGSHPCPASAAATPEPDPLTALVTLSLLEQRPDLVDLYQDLELQAELAATATDTEYRRRLQHRSCPEALLEQWWQSQDWERQRREADTTLQAEAIQRQADLEEQRQQNEQMRQQNEAMHRQLQRACADADLAVQQAAEVQTELETLLFSQQEQREQLTTTQQQLRAAQVELAELQDLAATRAEGIQRQQQQISETEQALLSVQSEVASSRQEADLALQQMQQVQAELEELLFANQELRQQQASLRRDRDELARQWHQDCAELELSRSRLQEASTELEHYVHLSREQARLLNRQNQLTGKALRLAAEATPQG